MVDVDKTATPKSGPKDTDFTFKIEVKPAEAGKTASDVVLTVGCFSAGMLACWCSLHYIKQAAFRCLNSASFTLQVTLEYASCMNIDAESSVVVA